MKIFKNKSILTILLIFIILCTFISTTSYCMDLDGLYNRGLLPEGSSDGSFTVNDLTGKKFESQNATNLANQFITVLSVIGSVLSVIVLIALGIKYMMGSVEEKAEYKKSLMPYVIGAALVFAASTIAGIFYNVITSM